MADVLVDTSVWVAFFHRSATPPWRPALSALIDQDAVVIVDPIVAELLYGAKGDREGLVILDLARGLRCSPRSMDTWIAAGDIGRSWRVQGRTLSVVDCLLAAVARRDGLLLWILDRDFEPPVAEGDLRLYSAG